MLPSTYVGDGGDVSTGVPTVQEEEEDIDMRLALESDPIVGTDLVISGANGPGALTPKPLSTPHSMTPRERAIHNLTRLPCHPGCVICAATRRANTMHLTSHEYLRVVPLLVADYCFMKSIDEDEIQPVLVMRLYPYKRVSGHRRAEERACPLSDSVHSDLHP